VKIRSMIVVGLYLILLGLQPCHAGQTITAAVDEDIITDYQLFVGERDPLAITHFRGPGARRDVIEIVLLQQALHLGGFTRKLVLRPENSYLRILRLIQDGQVALSGALVWKTDLKGYEDSLLISPALIHEGEFIAGLYTHSSNKKALNAKTLAALRQLSAASNNHWKSDIATLHELGIKRIHYATYWLQIVRMVVARRADVTLAPFQSNPDMKVLVGDLELVPIQGIKVSLPGSRHWPISKKHPESAAIDAALKRGIAVLEANKTIQRAYEESGFFHPGVKEWTLINPPSSVNSLVE
jgi:hypothetical protein